MDQRLFVDFREQGDATIRRAWRQLAETMLFLHCQQRLFKHEHHKGELRYELAGTMDV
jgi:hypothetical protein